MSFDQVSASRQDCEAFNAEEKKLPSGAFFSAQPWHESVLDCWKLKSSEQKRPQKSVTFCVQVRCTDQTYPRFAQKRIRLA